MSYSPVYLLWERGSELVHNSQLVLYVFWALKLLDRNGKHRNRSTKSFRLCSIGLVLPCQVRILLLVLSAPRHGLGYLLWARNVFFCQDSAALSTVWGELARGRRAGHSIDFCKSSYEGIKGEGVRWMVGNASAVRLSWSLSSVNIRQYPTIDETTSRSYNETGYSPEHRFTHDAKLLIHIAIKSCWIAM